MFWLAIFGVGGPTEGFNELAKTLYREADNFKVLAGLVVALPIGVLIHQFSVLIKNWIVGQCFSSFSDYPEHIDFSENPEIKKYYLDKISNLNSFYYVRFDNGFLAPLFAWIVIDGLVDVEVACYLILTAIAIAFVTLIYIPRIHCEIKFFRNKLGESEPVSGQL
tara:strand:+ start:1363 stop:1857 length:495 start_codon:yes stop_codon:yes gene_type:complete